MKNSIFSKSFKNHQKQFFYGSHSRKTRFWWLKNFFERSNPFFWLFFAKIVFSCDKTSHMTKIFHEKWVVQNVKTFLVSWATTFILTTLGGNNGNRFKNIDLWFLLLRKIVVDVKDWTFLPTFSNHRYRHQNVAKPRDYLHFLLHKNTKFSTFLKCIFLDFSLVKPCNFPMSLVFTFFVPPKLATFRHPFLCVFSHTIFWLTCCFSKPSFSALLVPR